jgi:hypothetical protein
MEDLLGVAQRYMQPDAASTVVISNPQTIQERPKLGLEVISL